MERPAGDPVHGDGHGRRGEARRGRPRGPRHRLIALALLVALAWSLAGCHGPTKPAPTPDEDDRAQLAKIVQADEGLDRALKAADDASRAGDDAKGAALLETDATRAATDAIAVGEHATLQTAWGRTRRDALVSVIHERSASIPSYAQAMRGEDLDAKLAVVTLQIDLQKRALEAAAAALAPTTAPAAPGDAG